MTVSKSSVGSLSFVSATTAEAVAHAVAISGTTGNVSSGGTAYSSGYYNASSLYQTTWENPIAINTLSKYLTSIPAADSKKIVSLLEDNARSLEDHLDNSYLKVSGGTVYGPTTLAGDIFLFGSVTVEDKPLIALLPPTGSMTMYGGTTAPVGWLLCNGAAVSRTTYASLYSIIGNNFGSGDGSTTFNLPNFESKFPLGTVSTPGSTGGSATITQGNLPKHFHGGPQHTHSLSAHQHTTDFIDANQHRHGYYVATTAQAGTNRSIISSAGIAPTFFGAIDNEYLSGTVSTTGPNLANTGNGGDGNTGDGADLLNTAYYPPYLGVAFIIKT